MLKGISALQGRAAIAVVLGAILALILAASASAGKPFPRIARDATISCSQAKAKVSVVVAWKKTNRKGVHRGHVVLLIRGKKSGAIKARKVSSMRLRGARTLSISYRFRFGKRASRRLCKGKARAVAVASHGQNKDGQGLVEIYRVARRTLGGKASGDTRTLGASGSGPADPEVTHAGGTVGSDCVGGGIDINTGQLLATITMFAQLQNCNLFGANLQSADLEGANLSEANLQRTDLSRANLAKAILMQATLVSTRFPSAILIGAKFGGAYLAGVTFFAANLNGADFSGIVNFFGDPIAAFTPDINLEEATCSGTTKPDGSMYPDAPNLFPVVCV